MSIRSGGRPRDLRQAHPLEEERHQAPWEPEYSSRETYSRGGGNGGNGGYGNGGYGRNRGGGGAGSILRFLAFALVLGGIVLVVLFTLLRPIVRDAVIGWAGDSPGALDVPFVADLVREDVGDALTRPASSDSAQVAFTIGAGESASSIAQRLEEEGFLLDRRAFVMIAVERELTDRLKTGEFILRRSMTPDDIVSALLDPPAVPQVDIELRTGLRLEQITAKLETLDGLTMDPNDFYELAKHPTPELLADYDWLDLPDGASLEGYLWPATYRVLPDTTGEELVRLMLDRFHTAIEGRMEVPAEREMSFYQVLTLASLVEREAILDEERALIAGVYQNRLDGKLGHRLLQADPTVIYAYDSVQLSELAFERWREYVFWNVPEGVGMSDVTLPEDLRGYQTYQVEGLIPGPICTPTLASIDAALAPDTKDEYVFFLAKRDGSDGHAFAATQKEHDANREKYGY
ncbi:MAG TPA: endolytic transglycosylase MltG [Candidatus Limnocylindrales bacterium]|nr:endolytic transglycosylase MltG [Candidatus Limnocylindrales bacterium]